MASKTYYVGNENLKIIKIQFSTPRGSDGRYVGVWFSVDFASQEMRYLFSLNALAVRAVVNGTTYQSYMAGSGITRMINSRWDDPTIGNPDNPEDYTQTLKLTALYVNTGSGWTDVTDIIIDSDGKIPDAVTFTFTPALNADATGALIDYYPWKFKWRKLSDNCTPYRHVYGPQAGDELGRVAWWSSSPNPDSLPIGCAAANSVSTIKTRYERDGDMSLFLRSDDADCMITWESSNVYAYDADGNHICTWGWEYVGARSQDYYCLYPVYFPEGTETLDIVLYFLVGDVAPSPVWMQDTLKWVDVEVWPDITLPYTIFGLNKIRPYHFHSANPPTSAKHIPLYWWDAAAESKDYYCCFMNVAVNSTISETDIPFVSSYTDVWAPYVYEKSGGSKIKLLLPDCSWDVELKWLDANGTPFILPFSIDGGKNTAKMTDEGYYDGDMTIILRSPSLTPEEMKIAATIGESLRIAVKFKEAQGRAYPSNTWVWAAVDDISIVNVEGEGMQVIEINLLR